MNRLQKKCAIVSGGLHLLLCLILVVGPAFLAPRPVVDDSPVLDVIPDNVTDGKSTGGNRNAVPPPPAPTQPPATPPATPRPPQAVKPVDPDPPKDTRRNPNALENPKPAVNLRLVTRKPAVTTPAKPTEATNRQNEQMDNARREISQTARSLRNNVSSTTTIDTNFGSGDGGPAAANYAQVVKSIYERAWQAPEDTSSDDAITKVTVTIASNGAVLSSRIIQPSGDPQVDRSIQRTLDEVTFIRPFPPEATDKQRTYTINFNLKAKRLLG